MHEVHLFCFEKFCLACALVQCLHHMLQVIRVIIFAVCYPVLKVTGYGINLRKAVVFVWAGLRGAVGLALSLFVLFDGQISDRSFRLLVFFFVGIIAAITICVQGTTTGFLLQVSSISSASACWPIGRILSQQSSQARLHAAGITSSSVSLSPSSLLSCTGTGQCMQEVCALQSLDCLLCRCLGSRGGCLPSAPS